MELQAEIGVVNNVVGHLRIVAIIVEVSPPFLRILLAPYQESQA